MISREAPVVSMTIREVPAVVTMMEQMIDHQEEMRAELGRGIIIIIHV